MQGSAWVSGSRPGNGTTLTVCWTSKLLLAKRNSLELAWQGLEKTRGSLALIAKYVPKQEMWHLFCEQQNAYVYQHHAYIVLSRGA